MVGRFFFFFFLDILDIFVILVHHIKHLSLVLRAYEHTFRQKVLWAFLLHYSNFRNNLKGVFVIS